MTSKDTNLTKAHVRYLESRLVSIIKLAERANVANGKEPGSKALPESDVADMEFFLAQMQVILPVVGLDFMRPSPRANLPAATPNTSTAAPQTLALYLKSDAHGIEARAFEADGEVTVMAGSAATKRDDFVSNTYAALRQQLIAEHRLKLATDNERYEFVEDVVFSSPSAAAGVIFNRNSNGRTAWRVLDTGETLKEWQDAKLRN